MISIIWPHQKGLLHQPKRKRNEKRIAIYNWWLFLLRYVVIGVLSLVGCHFMPRNVHRFFFSCGPSFYNDSSGEFEKTLLHSPFLLRQNVASGPQWLEYLRKGLCFKICAKGHKCPWTYLKGHSIPYTVGRESKNTSGHLKRR